MKRKYILSYVYIAAVGILLSFLFTRYEYVNVVDGPDEFLLGFPMVFHCSAWHTSMAEQFFWIPALIDFTFYSFIVFIAWWFVFKRIKVPFLTNIMVAFNAIFMVILMFLVFQPNNTHHLNVWFDYEVLHSGSTYILPPANSNEIRLEYFKYANEQEMEIEAAKLAQASSTAESIEEVLAMIYPVPKEVESTKVTWNKTIGEAGLQSCSMEATGLLDDSVKSARVRLIARKMADGWEVLHVYKSQQCYNGRGHEYWSPEPCI